MNIDRIISNSKKEMQFDIKYKDESKFMKLLDTLMFFNKNFHNYITTINNTIYFPTRSYFEEKPLSSISTLIHELVHIYDKNRMTFPVFSLLYLSPQILFLFAIPLFFILSIKFSLFFFLLLLPLPALGRAWLEYRAYSISIYTTVQLSKCFNISVDFSKMNNSICEQFIGSSYYFMFPFKNYILKKLNKVVETSLKNQHSFKDEIFEMADRILEKQ